MSDWQPIETAPKDGTYVLLCAECSNHPPAYPLMVAKGAFGEGGGWGYWCDQIDDPYPVWFTPTHWMPLPEPPKEAR